MKETSKRIVRVLPGVHEIWPLVTPALTSTSPFHCGMQIGGRMWLFKVAGALSKAPQQLTFSI